ncbi:MAG: hypothetical protein M3451_09665, partial [Chloroflexota bacterium]|nr:hypothetical protein [Chloroflexota bacterium]
LLPPADRSGEGDACRAGSSTGTSSGQLEDLTWFVRGTPRARVYQGHVPQDRDGDAKRLGPLRPTRYGSVLDMVEGEVLGTRFIEELLASVDAAPDLTQHFGATVSAETPEAARSMIRERQARMRRSTSSFEHPPRTAEHRSSC